MVLTKKELAEFTDPIQVAVRAYCHARSEENRLRLEIEIITSLQSAFLKGQRSPHRLAEAVCNPPKA